MTKKTKAEIDVEVADLLARKPKQVDLAETYLTRVDELTDLNEQQAAELVVLREEIVSLQAQLDNCTQANLELQRQHEALVMESQQ